MPGPVGGGGGGSTAGKKWKGSRQDVYFGKIKRRKAGGGTFEGEAIIKVKPEIVDLLNLPLATPEQKTRISGTGPGSRKIRLRGSKGAKSIKVPNPVDKRTAAGSLKYVSIPVPGGATIDDIEKFLKATKAESFSVGGGSYSVAK
jgi:hypothetical protein